MQTQSTTISAQDRLREAGIRVTNPRILVLQYLMENLIHPTCDQIYKGIKENDTALSFASVYNVTDKFVEAGLLVKLVSPDGEYHYDIQTHQHGHFFCEKCKNIWDFPLDDEFRIDSLPGAHVRSYNVSAVGCCGNCNK